MTRIKSLRGKRIVITGAAGGLGASLASRLYTSYGAHVLLTDHDQAGLQLLTDKLKEIRQGLLDAGETAPEFSTFAVDLTDRDALERFIEELRDLDVDILINNAGVVHGGSFQHMSPAMVETTLTVNLCSLIKLTHGLLPGLLSRPQAHIVNIASGAGLAVPGGMSAYVASKFGVVGFSRALRVELRHRGVGVSAICPAFIKTDIVSNSLRGVGQSEAEKARAVRLDKMVRKLGVSPQRVVSAIIRAILRDRGVMTVGVSTALLASVARHAPRLADLISRAVFRRMRSRDILH